MIYNVNCSTGFGIIPSFVFVFWFLRIISEDSGERGLVCSGVTVEMPELRHWHYSDLYFVNSGHVFFCIFLLKVIIVFLNIIRALSLSDVAIIESFLLTLSRRQSFPSRQEYFLIQNTFGQSPLLWLLVASAMSR